MTTERLTPPLVEKSDLRAIKQILYIKGKCTALYAKGLRVLVYKVKGNISAKRNSVNIKLGKTNDPSACIFSKFVPNKKE